jgi:type IV pilus assembly protein PilP
MKRARHLAIGLVWLLSLAALALAACSGEEAAVDDKPVDKTALYKKLEAERLKEEEAKKAAAEKPPYSYSPVGKRDPFRTYLAELVQAPEKSSQPKGATEQFEINQYRLVGLITGTSQPKAMVEDPEGVGHLLQVGSKLGRNGGRVKRITAKSIVVVEEFVDPQGKKTTVPMTIKLPDEAEGMAITTQ